jgi:hypothetical protein
MICELLFLHFGFVGIKKDQRGVGLIRLFAFTGHNVKINQLALIRA